MTARARSLAALVVASLTVLGTASAAQADTQTFTDPVGDAPATADITAGAFILDDDVVVWSLDVRDVRSTGRFRVKLYADDSLSRQTYYADIVRSGGKVTSKLWHRVLVENQLSVQRVSCPGKSAQWSQGDDTVSLLVPRDCVGIGDQPMMTAVGFAGSSKDYTKTLDLDPYDAG